MASPGGTFWFRKRKSEGVKGENRNLNFQELVPLFTLISC